LETGGLPSVGSRTITDYEDTRPLARKRLEGAALAMADAIVTDGSADLKFKALQKLDVVRDDTSSADMDVNVRVVLGVSANLLAQGQQILHDTPADEAALSGTVAAHDEQVDPVFAQTDPDERVAA
jgi:hypothetical protein